MSTENHNPVARYISRFLALRIVVKPTFTKEVEGRIVTVPGKAIRFEQGVFETSDKELIDFLESDKKAFGTTYIRVPDNIESALEERKEMIKDLEEREADLKRREDALKKKEAKIGAKEEGSKVKVTKKETEKDDKAF